MKANLFKRFPLLILAMALTMVACEPDEGPVDETDIRDEFIGRWAVTATSSLNGNSTYNVDIDFDTTTTDKVELINFSNAGTNLFVLGTVSTTANHVITIPFQDLDGSSINGFATSGNNNTLNFEYTSDNGIETDSITAVFVKQ